MFVGPNNTFPKILGGAAHVKAKLQAGRGAHVSGAELPLEGPWCTYIYLLV